MRRSVGPALPPYRLSLGNRPSHPEAYPTLSVGQAHRACRDGRDQLLWRDRNQVIAGAGSAVWPERGLLTFRYLVEERDYLDQDAGEITLQISWKGSQEDNKRPFASCPVCGREADVLVLFDRWCCVSKAHGLRHRSAQLTHEVRWCEELAGVEGAIAVAEATGAADRRLGKLIERRDVLRAKVGHRTHTANVMQRARFTREWVRPLALGSAL